MLKIDRSVIWENRSGAGLTRFMLRTASWNESDELLMTLQGITGSDYFHPVQVSRSKDAGTTWSEPEFIPALGRLPAPAGTEEGVCDVMPEYHPQTDTVLAIGHTVFYRDNRLFDSLGDFHTGDHTTKLQRKPVYVVGTRDRKWSPERQVIEFPLFADCGIYSCGSSQRVTLDDGGLIIPFTFGPFGRRDRMVCSVRCRFDGTTITAETQSNVLELPVGRGLLEPSLTRYEERFFMTIRAEDHHGYLTVSTDGLSWAELKAWSWDDDTMLEMSTTQQHWLVLGGKLYLVYTRKSRRNLNVMRWRAPLFIAEVDTERLCLKRATEQEIFPLSADGIHTPEDVGLMGNFNILRLNENTALAHVGEMLPKHGFAGNSLQAIIRTS